jgi:hypothetical protein
MLTFPPQIKIKVIFGAKHFLLEKVSKLHVGWDPDPDQDDYKSRIRIRIKFVRICKTATK